MALKFPIIIKNKFISTIIGTLGIYIGIGFIYNLILTLSMSFSASLGGLLESKIGFSFTTLLGTAIVYIANIFFFRIQNIWICYCLTLIIGVGAGISISLLGKNLTFYIPNKKGIMVSIIGLFLMVLAGGYIITAEKIISLEGKL